MMARRRCGGRRAVAVPTSRGRPAAAAGPGRGAAGSGPGGGGAAEAGREGGDAGGADAVQELVQAQVQLELDGLAGPVREAPGGEQPAARFFEGVVLAFGDGADVFRPGFLAQAVQDRGEGGGAPGPQVALQAAGAPEGGGQPHAAAGETLRGGAGPPRSSPP